MPVCKLGTWWVKSEAGRCTWRARIHSGRKRQATSKWQAASFTRKAIYLESLLSSFPQDGNGGSPHPCTRILKVYKEPLTEFRHMYSPDLNNTVYLKAVSLKMSPTVGTLAAEYASCGQGRQGGASNCLHPAWGSSRGQALSVTSSNKLVLFHPLLTHSALLAVLSSVNYTRLSSANSPISFPAGCGCQLFFLSLWSPLGSYGALSHSLALRSDIPVWE